MVPTQVAAACEDASACFSYLLADRDASALALQAWPGVPEAITQLGYTDWASFRQDAVDRIEAVYVLSVFCLSPPGDTFTRRGFWDALLVGCIPVVFHEHSRRWPVFFANEDVRAVTVMLPADAFAANPGVLEDKLRAWLPQVPAMQRAIAQQATGFQWAFSDLEEADHAEVGPDALDLALARLASGARQKVNTSAQL